MVFLYAFTAVCLSQQKYALNCGIFGFYSTPRQNSSIAYTLHCLPMIIWNLFFYLELNKNPVEGFSAGLIKDNDLYRWEVMIIGPPDTL